MRPAGGHLGRAEDESDPLLHLGRGQLQLRALQPCGGEMPCLCVCCFSVCPQAGDCQWSATLLIGSIFAPTDWATGQLCVWQERNSVRHEGINAASEGKLLFVTRCTSSSSLCSSFCLLFPMQVIMTMRSNTLCWNPMQAYYFTCCNEDYKWENVEFCFISRQFAPHHCLSNLYSLLYLLAFTHMTWGICSGPSQCTWTTSPPCWTSTIPRQGRSLCRPVLTKPSASLLKMEATAGEWQQFTNRKTGFH